MTNGEKFKEIFGISQVDEGELYAYAWLPNHDAAEISIDWWKAEYNEPVIRDNGVKNELNRVKNELEPTTKNDLGVDCISRADALMCLTGKFEIREYEPSELVSIFSKRIKALPSVTPQEPKIGHWIVQPSNKEQGERDFIWWKCSECGQVIFSETEKDRKEYHAFCGRCGAKMESEDKE